MNRLIFMALALLGASPLIAAEVLSNEAVLSLVKAGLGPDTVVAKIGTSATAFDLSAEQLVGLKQQGVPDTVLAAMLQASARSTVSQNAAATSDSSDPTAPHASGIYVLADWQTPAKMMRMDATTSNQTKSTGLLGYAFTGGIAKMKFKTIIPNPTARVKVAAARPAFYFYFDNANASLSRGGTGWMNLLGAPVTSPNEFSLVRFETTKEGRQTVLGQFNIAGMKSGVMDKARVAFTYSDVAPGVFKVTPEVDLEPGEYGFVYSASPGAGMFGAGAAARIFDFSVAR